MLEQRWWIIRGLVKSLVLIALATSVALFIGAPSDYSKLLQSAQLNGSSPISSGSVELSFSEIKSGGLDVDLLSLLAVAEDGSHPKVTEAIQYLTTPKESRPTERTIKVVILDSNLVDLAIKEDYQSNLNSLLFTGYDLNGFKIFQRDGNGGVNIDIWSRIQSEPNHEVKASLFLEAATLSEVVVLDSNGTLYRTSPNFSINDLPSVDNLDAVLFNDATIFSSPIGQLEPLLNIIPARSSVNPLRVVSQSDLSARIALVNSDVSLEDLQSNFLGVVEEIKSETDNRPSYELISVIPFFLKYTNEDICDDNIDNDSDGMLDCVDSDCTTKPGCGGDSIETSCGDGTDDDSDGSIDCYDSDCSADPGCNNRREICENGYDDDSDGAIDCSDSDCNCITPTVDPTITEGATNTPEYNETASPTPESTETAIPTIVYEDCGNGNDDDSDGYVDCGDPDCGCQTETPMPTATPEEVRLEADSFSVNVSQSVNVNVLQNDFGDLDPNTLQVISGPNYGYAYASGETVYYYGYVSGVQDSVQYRVCSRGGACGSSTVTFIVGSTNQEICGNGADDDGDGAIDCGDSDCACIPETPTPEYTPDYTPTALPTYTYEDCTNGYDDDYDGMIDCSDTDCSCQTETPSPTPTIEEMNLATDYYSVEQNQSFTASVLENDTGAIDPSTLQIITNPAYGYAYVNAGTIIYYSYSAGVQDVIRYQVCSNSGYCQNVDVYFTVNQIAIENCSNGSDDDSDGLIDCSDSDCACNQETPTPEPSSTFTPEPTQIIDPTISNENCENGVDDDFDGMIDCLDSECACLSTPTPEYTVEITIEPTVVPTDSPTEYPTETPTSTPFIEICSNAIDDDFDGLVDCYDSDCDCTELTPTATPTVIITSTPVVLLPKSRSHSIISPLNALNLPHAPIAVPNPSVDPCFIGICFDSNGVQYAFDTFVVVRPNPTTEDYCHKFGNTNFVQCFDGSGVSYYYKGRCLYSGRPDNGWKVRCGVVGPNDKLVVENFQNANLSPTGVLSDCGESSINYETLEGWLENLSAERVSNTYNLDDWDNGSCSEGKTSSQTGSTVFFDGLDKIIDPQAQKALNANYVVAHTIDYPSNQPLPISRFEQRSVREELFADLNLIDAYKGSTELRTIRALMKQDEESSISSGFDQLIAAAELKFEVREGASDILSKRFQLDNSSYVSKQLKLSSDETSLYCFAEDNAPTVLQQLLTNRTSNEISKDFTIKVANPNDTPLCINYIRAPVGSMLQIPTMLSDVEPILIKPNNSTEIGFASSAPLIAIQPDLVDSCVDKLSLYRNDKDARTIMEIVIAVSDCREETPTTLRVIRANIEPILIKVPPVSNNGIGIVASGECDLDALTPVTFENEEDFSNEIHNYLEDPSYGDPTPTPGPEATPFKCPDECESSPSYNSCGEYVENCICNRDPEGGNCPPNSTQKEDIFDNNRPYCECNAGFAWDPDQNECRERDSCDPKQEYFDQASWSCQRYCPDINAEVKSWPVKGGDKCYCKANYAVTEAGNCQKLPSNCTDAEYVAEENGEFVCKLKCDENSFYRDEKCYCRNGYYAKDGKCVAEKECPEDQYFSYQSGECEDLCPAGSKYDDGICCPNGSSKSGDGCCPAGTESVANGICCPNGSVFSGQGCCPNGTTSVGDGKCCPEGTELSEDGSGCKKPTGCDKSSCYNPETDSCDSRCIDGEYLDPDSCKVVIDCDYTPTPEPTATATPESTIDPESTPESVIGESSAPETNDSIPEVCTTVVPAGSCGEYGVESPQSQNPYSTGESGTETNGPETNPGGEFDAKTGETPGDEAGDTSGSADSEPGTDAGSPTPKTTPTAEPGTTPTGTGPGGDPSGGGADGGEAGGSRSSDPTVNSPASNEVSQSLARDLSKVQKAIDSSPHKDRLNQIIEELKNATDPEQVEALINEANSLLTPSMQPASSNSCTSSQCQKIEDLRTEVLIALEALKDSMIPSLTDPVTLIPILKQNNVQKKIQEVSKAIEALIEFIKANEAYMTPEDRKRAWEMVMQLNKQLVEITVWGTDADISATQDIIAGSGIVGSGASTTASTILLYFALRSGNTHAIALASALGAFSVENLRSIKDIAIDSKSWDEYKRKYSEELTRTQEKAIESAVITAVVIEIVGALRSGATAVSSETVKQLITSVIEALQIYFGIDFTISIADNVIQGLIDLAEGIASGDSAKQREGWKKLLDAGLDAAQLEFLMKGFKLAGIKGIEEPPKVKEPGTDGDGTSGSTGGTGSTGGDGGNSGTGGNNPDPGMSVQRKQELTDQGSRYITEDSTKRGAEKLLPSVPSANWKLKKSQSGHKGDPVSGPYYQVTLEAEIKTPDGYIKYEFRLHTPAGWVPSDSIPNFRVRKKVKDSPSRPKEYEMLNQSKKAELEGIVERLNQSKTFSVPLELHVDSDGLWINKEGLDAVIKKAQELRAQGLEVPKDIADLLTYAHIDWDEWPPAEGSDSNP